MTLAQIATLKTSIEADVILNALPKNDDTAFDIAAAYNTLASPVFIVWKSSITTQEAKTVVVWTEYIGRSAGERGAFEFMLSTGTIDPSNANVRAGIADVFSGAGGAGSRNALTALAKRSATRAEKLFATGTGSDASPAMMGFEGNVSFRDVAHARG